MSKPERQLALPLYNKPETVVELALGFTRQVPLSYLKEQWESGDKQMQIALEARLTEEGMTISGNRLAVIKAMIELRQCLEALDRSLGFDPNRFEVSSPSSSTTSKEK